MVYLLLASVGLAVVITWVRGGQFSRLGEVDFRLWWVVPLVAVGQSLLIRLAQSDTRLAPWHPRPLLMMISYGILWYVVWLNRQLPGMGVVLVGVTLNGLAIIANGGYMPVTPDALARTGAGQAVYQWAPGTVVLGSKDVLLPPNQARLWMLGDVLVIPAPFPWPTAMSIGDVLLAVGIFLFIVQTTIRSSEKSNEKK